MYREMKKKDREIVDIERNMGILKDAEYGILSTVSKDGQPYGIPLNHVLHDGAIYFHCAKEGQKLDNIAFNERVSYCVVGSTMLVPENFTTKFVSVIVFGSISEVTDEEKIVAFEELVAKYSPDFVKKGKQVIKEAAKFAKMFKISIDHITGKEKK